MSARSVYVRDVSVVSPYALLMFGGDINIQHQRQLVSVDNIITLKVFSWHVYYRHHILRRDPNMPHPSTVPTRLGTGS